MNILLVIQLVVSVLLIVSILLQQAGTDGLSGLGGSSNMGLVTTKSANSFLVKITVVLAIVFFINSIVLANLSNNKNTRVKKIHEQMLEEASSIPVAK